LPADPRGIIGATSSIHRRGGIASASGSKAPAKQGKV
jgi:hypothetical protein